MNPFRLVLRALVLSASTAQIALAQTAPNTAPETTSNDSLLWLAVITLTLGIGVGIWQWFRVQKAKRNREHTSFADMRGSSIGNKPNRF